MYHGKQRGRCSPLRLRLKRALSRESSSQPSSPTRSHPNRSSSSTNSLHSSSLESLRSPRPQSDGNFPTIPVFPSKVTMLSPQEQMNAASKWRLSKTFPRIMQRRQQRDENLGSGLFAWLRVFKMADLLTRTGC